MECARNIWQTKGLAGGLYAGFLVFVLREIPFCQLQYPIYELLNMTTVKFLASGSKIPVALTDVPIYVNAVNGAIAGAIAGFLTTPLDVLKTRLMTF